MVKLSGKSSLAFSSAIISRSVPFLIRLLSDLDCLSALYRMATLSIANAFFLLSSSFASLVDPFGLPAFLYNTTRVSSLESESFESDVGVGGSFLCQVTKPLYIERVNQVWTLLYCSSRDFTAPLLPDATTSSCSLFNTSCCNSLPLPLNLGPCLAVIVDQSITTING